MEGKSYPLDASLQLLESEETPMHVGALLTFRKPENASSDFESVLAEKLRNQSEPVPPWNYVPLRAPLNLLQLLLILLTRKLHITIADLLPCFIK